MALDELLKGLQVLDQGLSKFAIGQGISRAQEQIAQINQTQTKELEKRQALSGVANNLVATLSQAGADPTQIQQVAGSVMPKALNSSQDFLALGASTGDKQVSQLGQQLQQQESAVQTGENAKQRALTREMGYAQMANAREMAGMKGGAKLQEHEFKAVEKTAKLFEEKNVDVFKNYQNASTSLAMLNSNNPVADKGVLNAFVKASGDTGAITEGDRKAFAGSEAWPARIKRWTSQISTGKLDDKSRGELKQLAELYKKRAAETTEANARRHAARLSKQLGVPPEELMPKIFPGFEAMDGVAPTAGGSAALPPGVPQGSVEATFSKNGQTVKGWKTPDGKFLAPKAK